jgi:uncharacterized protein (DUF427 family)
MSKAPGHAKWPSHRVDERHLEQRVIARVNNEIVADSRDVIRVEEDGSPDRFYFPRGDVKMEKLSSTPTRTECPFKGHASYFSISTGGHELKDAAWSYESPYDEHADLKERIAFYTDKVPEIEIRTM